MADAIRCMQASRHEAGAALQAAGAHLAQHRARRPSKAQPARAAGAAASILLSCHAAVRGPGCNQRPALAPAAGLPRAPRRAPHPYRTICPVGGGAWGPAGARKRWRDLLARVCRPRHCQLQAAPAQAPDTIYTAAPAALDGGNSTQAVAQQTPEVVLGVLKPDTLASKSGGKSAQLGASCHHLPATASWSHGTFLLRQMSADRTPVRVA